MHQYQKASKNKEEALHGLLVHVVFDKFKNKTTTTGGGEHCGWVLFYLKSHKKHMHQQSIRTNASSMFFEVFLGIGTYLGCPGICCTALYICMARATQGHMLLHGF